MGAELPGQRVLFAEKVLRVDEVNSCISQVTEQA